MTTKLSAPSEETKTNGAGEMEAGRELDGLVAEIIMRWKWAIPNVNYRRYSGQSIARSLMHPSNSFRQASFLARARMTEPLARDWDHYVLHYSTEIESAWYVVEKMGAKFWMTLLTPYDLADGMYHVSFTPHGKPEHGYRAGHAVCKTAPLAICRAALAAATGDK